MMALDRWRPHSSLRIMFIFITAIVMATGRVNAEQIRVYFSILADVKRVDGWQIKLDDLLNTITTLTLPCMHTLTTQLINRHVLSRLWQPRDVTVRVVAHLILVSKV